MGCVIRRLKMVIEPTFHVERLLWRIGADKSERIVFIGVLTQTAGQIGVGSTGELHGQMSVHSHGAKDIGPERPPADVNADIAVCQLERTGQIGDIQYPLRAKKPLRPVVIAIQARAEHVGVLEPTADRLIIFDGDRLVYRAAVAR